FIIRKYSQGAALTAQLSIIGILSGATILAEEPKMSTDDSYLKYELPKDAKCVENNARPGSEYAVVVGYYVGKDFLGYRCFWDLEKTKLHSEVLRMDELTHGVQRTWYKNGQLKSESPYKAGKMHGTFKQWDDN